MAQPEADFSSSLNRLEYRDWERNLKTKSAQPTPLPEDPGPGAPVLCSSATAAVEYAGRIFKDRRIEVKPAFADPILEPPNFRWRMRPLSWRFWSRLGFFSGWIRSEESPELVKQRMVQLATRLIGLAKEHEEANFVGEPFLIRLLALKLTSIGYAGPMTGCARYGHSSDFEYEIPSAKDLKARSAEAK